MAADWVLRDGWFWFEVGCFDFGFGMGTGRKTDVDPATRGIGVRAGLESLILKKVNEVESTGGLAKDSML